MARAYNQGMVNVFENDFENALHNIDEFVRLAKAKGRNHLLNSNFYQTRGQAYLEMGRYVDAIADLSKAIEKDPSNKLSYFYRAVAYFETGKFEKSLEDYLSTDLKKIPKSYAKSTSEFTQALFSGLYRGGKESLGGITAFIGASLHGCEKALWATIDHPLEAGKHVFSVCQETAQNLANACAEISSCLVDYCRNTDWENLKEDFGEYAEDIKKHCEQFAQLSEAEKGDLMGHVIGKFGTDILIGGATLKGLQAVQSLKNANRLCNLEALASSATTRETIIVTATEHSIAREAYFRNIKCCMDKQGKHIVGHRNYDMKNSI